MAGHWIKVEHTTPDKPEVVRMAAALRIDQDAVVGKLVRIWVWADENSVDGNAIAVTDAFIDRKTGRRGFAAAMRSVGWLVGEDGALTFPQFDRHNGNSAKARVETNRRVAEHRKRNADVTPPLLPKPLPEERKRREDNSSSTAAGAGAEPLQPSTILRLHPHCSQIEAEEWAQRRNGSVADGVRITPEIVVSWWEDRTRTGWVVVKGEATIPLNSPQAVEIDLVRYARNWARNDLQPKIQRNGSHANRQTTAPPRNDTANRTGRYAGGTTPQGGQVSVAL